MSGWKEIVAKKRARVQAAIPSEWLVPDNELPGADVLDVYAFPETSGRLTAQELTITKSTVSDLLPKLASGEWSAVSVTTAFYKRAIIAHQLTTCLTEIFVEQALARAELLDKQLKETGKVVGPLHGLPISLKDQISIQGLDSSMGYVSWIGKPAEKNAVLVDLLLSLGAIPFCKTNVPQTLMWPETFNHIFGRTTNPHNRSLTSGGSSGGEGALLALKGSPLGVGSDIGGSVRIPAGLCGIYSLRPSYHRVPYAGCVNSLEGQDSIPSVLGPMSHSIDALKIFFQSLLSQKPWLKDPLTLRMPWRDDEYALVNHGSGKKLCFGVMWDDRRTKPHPPIIRGLEIVKNALIAAGHEVIDWNPLNHEKMNACLVEIWGSGALQDYKTVVALSGEPLLDTMVPSVEISEAEVTSRRGAPAQGLSAYELWQAQKQKTLYRQEYLAHWEATSKITSTGRPVDAIISPIAAYAAPPHGFNRYPDYTTVWNFLDYAAMVVPVGKVDPALDTKQPPHEFFGDRDRENYEFYDPDTFKNAPIAVQIVGRTQEEEAVIAMGEIVDAAVRSAERARL